MGAAPVPSANRDPAGFDRPSEVVIHCCVASRLARVERRVALEAWLDAFPSFELADPSAVRWSAGQVRGPRTLPLRISS